MELLERIRSNDRALHSFTGLTRGEFQDRYAVLEASASRDPKAPLFRFDGSPAGGNRCSLLLRHVFMLALHHDRASITQEQLGVTYGIDQSNVSRYIKYLSETMDRLFPDPKSLTKEIKKCRTKREFYRLVPGGRLMFDGSRTPHVRPEDGEGQKAAYSGKIKQHSLNTLIAVNERGETVWMSETHPGSVHDVVIADELKDAFARAIREKWVTFNCDSGFQGIVNRIKGIQAITPKKGTKNPPLTKREKRENRKMRSERAMVENTFAFIKNNGITRTKFRGTPKEFNRIFNVQAGKVNFHMAFDSIRRRTGALGRLMAEKDRRLVR